MKLSETWLREWINPDITTGQLVEQLTMAGLEVASVIPAALEFSQVVVGEVIACEKHPDAKRLHICQVNVGTAEPLSIVCGGINVRAGIKVPVAMIGAKLPGDIKIKKTKLRGEVSAGMICAAKELGIEQFEDLTGGIMELPTDAPVGMDFRDYYQLNDQIIDIELTPNRGDCFSILGIAREVAVLNKIEWQPPKIKEIPAVIDDTFPVTITDFAACPRYVGRVIHQINPAALTPLWMQERLRRADIRSIHPVVDICNYVMLALGQPMHAFDMHQLQGSIVVRLAQEGETITLLDKTHITLQADTLVIADEKQPQAIAGIMGGADSAVNEKTTSIFLESAFFEPVHLRLDARRYNLQTDSSQRFERGVDFTLQARALEYATALILDILGGEPGPVIDVVSKSYLPKNPMVILRREQIKRTLGIELDDLAVTSQLQSLGMICQPDSQGWQVTVPSYRFDIIAEVDLIEELARIYGYANIPTERIQAELVMPQVSETKLLQSDLTEFLVGRGFQEAITYSFIDEKLHQLLSPQYASILIQNPIASDMAVMRASMWPGLLQTYMRNANRQIERIRLFEIGLCFIQEKGTLQQIPKLGMLISGDVFPEQWGYPSRKADFFDLKGDVTAMLALTRNAQEYVWRSGTHPALHPGQRADLYQKDQIVGHLGALHPKIAQHLDLNEVPYVFEIMVKAIEEVKLPAYQAVSKFPAIRRDIAIVVDEQIASADILAQVEQVAGNLLHSVQLFDIYQGKGVAERKKSMALGLVFQDPQRTLTDDEINAIIQNVVAKLQREFNAQLRA